MVKGDPGSVPRSGKTPWRRDWLPTPVFLPGEFHGKRSLSELIYKHRAGWAGGDREEW